MTYIPSILKRKPVRAYNKEETRQICMQHLDQQLQEKKPSLILCLGNVAVQSFFRDSEAEVKTLRGSWHEVQGYPTTVAYHPARSKTPSKLALIVYAGLGTRCRAFPLFEPLTNAVSG